MTSTAQPQWIAKMYPTKTGRDHLGLGSVSSNEILHHLSPGINVLTFHPRYHSFFTFLLDEFWQRDLPRNRAAWVKFYRARAFIYSLGAHLCDRPEHGDMGNVVGSQKTEGLSLKDQPSYNTSENYIKSALGGFGLYYRTVMIELGLIYPGGTGFPYPIDVPTEETGKAVAVAFRSAVKDTTYYRDYFDKDIVDIPTEVIREYIRKGCLCQLKTDDAPDRELMRKVFLQGGTERDAAARQMTIRMFLDIANQTESKEVDEGIFRQLIFFNATPNHINYTPSPAIIETHRLWRLYQLREYYAFALNTMWFYLCEWGLHYQGDMRPIPMTKLRDDLHLMLNFDDLAEKLNLAPPGLTAESSFISLLEWVQSVVGTNGNNFDARCNLDSPIHEHKLYELVNRNQIHSATMIAGMVTMLTLVVLRFGKSDIRQRSDWMTISRMGAKGRLSVEGFLQQIQRRMDSGPITIHEVVRWILRDYVILQHQLIATSKLPDNTFRFRREGNLLRFYEHYNALMFRDSRFRALSTITYELGFCGDFNVVGHGLTSDGRKLLEEGTL